MRNLLEQERELSNKNPIESATTFETAIPIVDEEECIKGLKYLRRSLARWNPAYTSVVPIMRGGIRVGEFVAGSKFELNPMRMSHTNPDNTFSPVAKCLVEPDYTKILRSDGGTNRVVFTEAVAETQASILGAREVIDEGIREINRENHLAYELPQYGSLVLATKFGDSRIEIPGLVRAFSVSPKIWLFGWGCDDAERGREANQLMGTLSPGATEPPGMPYFRRLF